MKTLHKALLILILIVGAAFYLTQPLSLTGTPVNVHFGDIPTTNPYDTVGRYYMAEFDVAGDSAGLVFVPSGLSYNQDRLELKISSTASFYKAPLKIPPTYLQYRQVKYVFGLPGLEWKNVDYRDVSLNNPIINTYSNVQLSTPGNDIETKKLIQEGELNNIDDTVQRFTVVHEGVERTIYIKYDNLVFKRGDLPPAGDYVAFKDYIGKETLVRYDHLSSGTGDAGSCYADDWNDWNCVVTNSFVRFKFSDFDSYEDYSKWMYSNTKLPNQCPPAAQSCKFVGGNLVIQYPSTVFTQHVTVYVPEELAEFIMIVEQTPKFRFDEVDLIKTNEGDLTIVEITGFAESSGTIDLFAEGAGLETFNWGVTGSEKQIVKGESYTFKLYIRSPQVDSKTTSPIKVTSRPLGFGETTSVTFYNEISDISGLTTYDLSVNCIDSNDKLVSNAEIYVDNEFIGYGSATKSVVKGNHYVYAKNVTGWYAGYTSDHQMFVAVNEDKTVEITFTTEPPKPEPFEYTELLIYGIFAIIAVILLSLIANELGAKITPNQIGFIVVLVVVAILGYIALSATYDLLDRIVTAIEDFELI